MASLVFFIVAFIALVGAAFMFANQENSRAAAASAKADMALRHVQATDAYVKTLEEKVTELTAQIAKLVEAIAIKDDQSEKTKQKIEWLEMKANNQPRPPVPTTHTTQHRVTLLQEKPLQINVLYREAKPRPLPTTEIEPKAKKALTDQIKKKLHELSQ